MEVPINRSVDLSSNLRLHQVEKVWGRDVLPAPFKAPAGCRIGEIWFEPPASLPEILVKYIFTSENLSVQVHPSDAQAAAARLGRRGKAECWLIVEAEPGAVLGIGFKEPIAPDAMRQSALDGTIERLLAWHPVTAGDFFYIPAGTVHAIGKGISLIEVQQNSDVTYRLYDYGRPRELHLTEGVAVARGERYDLALRSHVPQAISMRLVNGPIFRVDQVFGGDLTILATDDEGPLLVIPRDVPALICGHHVVPGACGLAEKLADVSFASTGTYLVARPPVYS